MIIYNVTSKVSPGIVAEWLRWMKEDHVPELLRTGLFIEGRICRLLEQDETEGVTFTTQFTCDSMEDYHEYLHTHAPAMREKTLRKFGDQYLAFRTVMQVEG